MDDVNLEATIIGSALYNPQALDPLLELEPGDMETRHGIDILNTIKLMHEAGEGIDLVTVDARTDKKYTNYLIEASTRCASMPFRFSDNVKLLKERGNRKRIGREAQKLLGEIVDPMRDPAEVVEEAIARLRGLTATNNRSISSKEAALAFARALDRQEERRATFGIAPLGDALGGIFGEKLVVVGARPATGKSALAVSAAMATQARGKVLFCSYEMTPEEIVGRMVANLSGVDSQSIAYRKLGIVEYDRIYPAISGAAGFNIVFRPDANTPGKIRAEAIRQKKDGDLALIVVDYLQQMSSGMRAESRRVEVGQISRALKQLAMETGVPVLALSQLNRQSEGTASKAPTMAEMRESGDIEQDADVIILMHVPATREDHVEQIKEMGQACVRMTLEKNRQGKSGQVIDVAFDGARMLFRRVRDVIGGQT